MYKWIVCFIMATVSSQGDMINVDQLRYIKDRAESRSDDGKTGSSSSWGCDIYQLYNPYVIHSDWNCEDVERSIMQAMREDCGNV